MKKFIIKKIREDCYFDSAHPCCNYFRKKVSKLCFILTVLISFNSYAQLVGSSAVKANFGVEADAYANVLEFGGLTGAAGTDDWFVNSAAFPILVPGKGVVDQSNAAAYKAQVLGDNNTSFEVRQANYPITFPFPYPVVDGYLWLDTVYGRDNNSAQGNSDNSIFASTADKNSDNPSTWVLGTGSIPQKVDIIDAMAHLRGEGPRMPYDPNTGDGVDDPRPFTTLYAFAGATLRSTDGSKHIDFEFFRTKVGYVPGGSALTNTGSDGGRTAFTFNADGSVDIPGALIVSIDYENGGTRPDVRIRVWMSQTDFNTINSKGNRPFNVIPGSFVQGELSGVYGYARIEALDAANPYIWGRVNLEADSLAAPWGTLDSENAAYSDDFQAQQFVEIGINLTAFGLDKKGGSDPCANILGSLLVKTRSSAGGQQDSFTSEQKDFAGPYIFGTSIDPVIDLAKDGDLTCLDGSVTLTATLDNAAGLTFAFYGPSGAENGGKGPLLPADSAEPDLTRVITTGGTYTVVASSVSFPGCERIDTVTVDQETPNDLTLTCPQPVNAEVCFYKNQAEVDAAFDAWRDQFKVVGGAGLVQSPTQAQLDALVAPLICGGEVSVTLKAHDNCNTEKTCGSTFKVNGDKTAPVIADKDDVALEGCNPDWPAVVTTTYTDNCDEGGSINGVPGNDRSSADGCTQYRDYTFNKTDSCGNAATPQVVTYSRHYDVSAPVIADKPDVALEGCNPAWPEVVTTTYSDVCDGNGSINGVPGNDRSSADGCTQYRDYTFNKTDSCGNAATPQVVTYSRHYDVSAPVIADKPDVALEGCNPAWPAVVTTTYSDNCDGGGSINGVAGNDRSSADGCTQYREYTFNKTDSCGNAATPQVVTYSRHWDKTTPVIADKDDVALSGCNPDWPAVVTTTYSDNCDGGGSLNGVAGNDRSSADGCTQYRDYTFNKTDNCGNVAATQTVTYSRHWDKTAPVIADKDDVALQGCNPDWPAVVTTTYSDNCDGGGSINGVAGNDRSSADGCTQYRDYTFNKTDGCGNAATPQVVTYSRHWDKTAPVIADKDDVALTGCNPDWPAVVTTTYTDNCDGGGSLNGVAGNDRSSADGCTQYRDYTFNKTDNCGNVAATQTVTYSRHFDETKPVIADKDDVLLPGCNPAFPTALSTTWSDNCDSGGTIQGVAGQVRSSADGCTQYLDFTFNVKDSCENSANQVVVTYSRHWDKTAPELSCPSNYEWDGCEEIPVLVPPVAKDNCDGDIVAVGTRSDGLALNDPFPVGQIITVTYTATDRCQNSASCNFTVYISPCTGSNCSYTQGFYGNVNGNACLPDGGFSKAQAIMAQAVDATDGILGNSIGSVVFGNQSKNGNYFLLKLSDINTYNGDTKEVAKNNIFKMLPGGGTPRALVDYATYDDASTWQPDSDPLNYAKGKRGSINNNLLSQTMTLFFNISLDSALGNVKLKTNFKTVDELGCGTDESNPSDPGEMFAISQNVIDYWGPGATPTVDDLYELANLVLAGTVTSVSASEVNGAVDAINRGFDGCRIEVSTDVVPSVVINGASEDEPVFEPFPVPFNDVITLRYKFNYKSDVNIQMFDTKGALLMTERDNNPFFNKEITIRPRFNRGEGQMFFIKVITNRGVSIKKVISEK